MYVLGRYFGDVIRYFRERREARGLEARALGNLHELTSLVRQCELRRIPVNLPFDLLTGADKMDPTDPTSFQFKLLNVAPYYIGKYRSLLSQRAAKATEVTGPIPVVREELAS